MDWILLAQILNLLLFSIAIYYLSKGKVYMLLPVLFFAMAIHGFNFLLGTLWFPYKIVNIVIFLYVIFKVLPQSSVDKTTYISFSIIFALSLGNALLNLPTESVTTGSLQSPLLRPLIQLYTYFSVFSLIIFIPHVINSERMLKKADTYYMRISEFMIITGIIHFIFIKLGIGFMPILRSHGEHSEIAKFSTEGIIFNRIYGFMGEPKTFATILLPYFFVSLYKLQNGIINRNKRYHTLFTLLAVFVIVQTYSSAALIALFLTIIVGLILKFFNLKRKFIFRAAGVVFVLFLIGNVLIDRGERFQKVTYMDFLVERSFGRVEKELEERAEILVLDGLIDKAAIPFMGYGPGMCVFAIEGLVYSKGINRIDSGWITVFSDLGVLGVLIYFFIIGKTLVDRKKINNKLIDYYNAYLLGFISVVLGMLGNYEPILFPLMLGFLFAITKLSSAET